MKLQSYNLEYTYFRETEHMPPRPHQVRLALLFSLIPGKDVAVSHYVISS